MNHWKSIYGIVALIAIVMPAKIYASQDTIGPNGINSVGLTTKNGVLLTGFGASIGQVELNRPGKRAPSGSDDAAHSNATIDPTSVFLHGNPGFPPANMNINNHAEQVAGILISTDATRTGVATEADLYASAIVGDAGADFQAAESAQLIATRNSNLVDAINFSFGVTLFPDSLDGNALITQFVDWSASRHDVLYVVAGVEDSTIDLSLPTDNFNGITVAALTKESDGMYRRVGDFNIIDEEHDAVGFRTSTSLLAPGDEVQVRVLEIVLLLLAVQVSQLRT
jgi:hypothetical protein